MTIHAAIHYKSKAIDYMAFDDSNPNIFNILIAPKHIELKGSEIEMQKQAKRIIEGFKNKLLKYKNKTIEIHARILQEGGPYKPTNLTQSIKKFANELLSPLSKDKKISNLKSLLKNGGGRKRFKEWLKGNKKIATEYKDKAFKWNLWIIGLHMIKSKAEKLKSWK